MIDCRVYWPMVYKNDSITKVFNNGYQQQLVRSINFVGATSLIEILNGKWLATWYLYHDPERGVLEFCDDLPKTQWFQKAMFWQPCVRSYYIPGQEIVWGNKQDVGDLIEHACVMKGLFGQSGTQTVDFIEILPTMKIANTILQNVLVIVYSQKWGNGPPSGAKYYLAPNLGMVQIEWMANGLPTGYSVMMESYHFL